MPAGSLTGGGITLAFDSEWPTGMNRSKNADWVAVAPISRECPVLGYASSGSTSVSFTIRLSTEEGGQQKSVMERVKEIRKFVVPMGYRPPEVTLTIGDWLDEQGVIESVSESVPDEAAWIGFDPSVVDITITFKECHN
jgi:hypothetical protein